MPSPANPKPGRTIDLATYTGEPVPNEIDADPSPGYVKLFEQGFPKFANLEVTGQPTGRYNCHGFTFGNRRTWIDRPDLPVDIDAILIADRYARVEGDIRVGDLAIYRRNGSIVHSGVVTHVEPLGQERIPSIRSKWGAAYEMLHHPNTLAEPYDVLEYWRLRE